MSKYESITKYIPEFSSDNIGQWIIDKVHTGESNDPINFPWVDYSKTIESFMRDVYSCYAENVKNQYNDVLEKNNIEWERESMKNANLSQLDEECLLALILGAIRAERFCDGALLSFFKCGLIENCLLKLQEYDNK